MSISARAAGFRFSERQYVIMDEIKAHFWMLFRSRKAVLDFALESLWDAFTMQRSVVDSLRLLQRALRDSGDALCEQQLEFNFKTSGFSLRPVLHIRYHDEEKVA